MKPELCQIEQNWTIIPSQLDFSEGPFFLRNSIRESIFSSYFGFESSFRKTLANNDFDGILCDYRINTLSSCVYIDLRTVNIYIVTSTVRSSERTSFSIFGVFISLR